MTFYETRGGNQLATIPTPYQNGFHWEHDWTQVMTWDPEKHVDIDSAPFITDYNNFRERTESGTVTRDKLVSGDRRAYSGRRQHGAAHHGSVAQ
ncbi:hypothetical protein M5585_15260 [Serratia ureilytica]